MLMRTLQTLVRDWGILPLWSGSKKQVKAFDGVQQYMPTRSGGQLKENTAQPEVEHGFGPVSCFHFLKQKERRISGSWPAKVALSLPLIPPVHALATMYRLIFAKSNVRVPFHNTCHIYGV